MYAVSLDEEDIQKINALRVVLEAEALRLAKRHLNPQREAKLEQLLVTIENMEPSPAKLSMRVDFEFHRTIWSYSGNEYLEKILTSLTAPLFAHSVRTLLRGDKLRTVLDSHRPLLDFISGRAQETAEQVMLAHLSVRYREPERFSSISPLARRDGAIRFYILVNDGAHSGGILGGQLRDIGSACGPVSDAQMAKRLIKCPQMFP